MAISKDTLEQRIDKLATEDELNDAEFGQVVDTPPIEEADFQDSGIVDEQNYATQEPGPIKVAGLRDVISGGLRKIAGSGEDLVDRLGKRVGEAEKKVVPPIGDEPVQKIGDTLVVREATTEEVADLYDALDAGYTGGLNVVRIGDNLNGYDVGEHLERVKQANAGLFEAQKRGTINFEAIERMAVEQGMDNIIAEWLARTPGTGEVAEKVVAGLIAARQITNETIETLRTAQGLPMGPEREAAYSKFLKLMTIEGNLYANLSGAVSEAGRVLYATQKLGDGMLGRRASEIASIFGAADTKDIEYLGELYLAIPTRAGKAKFVQQGILSRTMDQVVEVWINSILTHPATHMVNIAGNSIFQATKIAETMVASGFGKLRSTLPGQGNTQRVQFREALIRLDSIRESLKDALIVSGRTLLTEEPTDIVSKIDVRNRRAIGTTGDPRVVTQMIREGNVGAGFVNTLGISARMGGRFLLAEDEFFKGIAYRSELRVMAHMRGAELYDAAIDAGKTVEEAKAAAVAEEVRILNNPPAGLVEDARDAARTMTFQGDLDGFLGSMQGVTNHPVVKLFVPFYKTPVNVMRETLARSPAMLANPNFYKKIAAGGREADLALAQVATGSAVMSIFAYHAMGVDDPDQNVIIMGSGPSDRNARAAMARRGLQPYSINFKNEDGTYTSITYSKLDPISGMLAMAADFAYYAQHEQDQGVLETLATAAVVGIAGYMQELPMLDGIKALGGILNQDTDKKKLDAFVELLAKKGTEAGLSLMPLQSAFGAGIKRMNDPVAKNTMLPAEGFFGVDPTAAPAVVRGFYLALQAAKARNPLYNDDLPPRLNLWGEKVTVGTGQAWEMFSPIRIQNTQYAPVDEELMSLGQGIPMPQKRIDGVLLNATQYNQLITYMNDMDSSGNRPGMAGYRKGQTMLDALMFMIEQPAYQDLPTREEKLTLLRAIVSKRKAAALKLLRQNDLVLNEKILEAQ